MPQTESEARTLFIIMAYYNNLLYFKKHIFSKYKI